MRSVLSLFYLISRTFVDSVLRRSLSLCLPWLCFPLSLSLLAQAQVLPLFPLIRIHSSVLARAFPPSPAFVLQTLLPVLRQGPLPTTFGANFYEARRNWSFDGLTGSVSFDENGDRVVASGTWSLSNVLLDAATNEFELVLKAVFDGGRWVWRAGKRDLVYNYRSTDEPVDQLQPPSPPPSPPPPPPAGDKFLLLLIVAAVAAAILFCKTHSPPRAKQRLKGRISENFF
eukprot:6177257-Pleurochrysis_carterae.AAC.2